MTTTIQISDTTRQILEHIKSEEKAASYDHVIKHLVQQHTHVPRSMFGTLKGSKKWTKKDRGTFHEL